MKKSKKSKKRLKKQSHNKLLIALAVFFAILIALAGYLYLTRSRVTAPQTTYNTDQIVTQEPTPEPAFVPYNATFQIVIDGETRTFTDPRYHNKSADVYITPEGSRQVQITVAQPNITWGILFATLPMSVTNDCIVTGTNQTFCTNANRKLRFYINDVESPEALKTVIEPRSQLKVVY